MLKHLIQNTIRRLGYEIFKTPAATRNEHQTIIPLASYAPWNLDSLFTHSCPNYESQNQHKKAEPLIS
jgi:hypothetical protein